MKLCEEAPFGHVSWPLVKCKWRRKYLICLKTPQCYAIEGSCNFMGGNLSFYVTTLPSLMAVVNVVVEMFLFCHVIIG